MHLLALGDRLGEAAEPQIFCRVRRKEGLVSVGFQTNLFENQEEECEEDGESSVTRGFEAATLLTRRLARY